MRNSKRYRSFLPFLLAVAAGALFFSPLASADGDLRAVTQAEKDAYRTAIATFAKAVPGGPAGWDTREQTSIGELERVSADNLQVEYLISWQDTARKQSADEEKQAALTKQYTEQAASPEAAANDQLRAQYEQLAKEFGDALGAGDNDKAQELQAEMDEIAAKMNAYYAACDQAQSELIEKMAPHDVEAGIRILANQFSYGFNSASREGSSIAGGTVYRTEGRYTPGSGWIEGSTCVFLGSHWRLDTGAGECMNYDPDAKLPLEAIQAIIVEIRADPERAKTLIAGIDWNSIAKLIRN